MGNCYSAPKLTKMVSVKDLDLTKIMRAMLARLASPDGAGSRAMRLDLGIMAGENTKEFLASLASLTDRLEKVADRLNGEQATVKAAVKKAKTPQVEAEEDDAFLSNDDAPEVEVEAGEDFTPAPKKAAPKKQAVASFDDEEDEVVEAPVKKAAKPAKEKKLTVDDVNAACMDTAKRINRAHVLSILKTKFKVTSVTALEPAQYGDVIKAMQA